MGRIARVHLKIDTGMNRIGVKAPNAVSFALAVSGMKGIEIVGMFTHFVSAQAPDRKLAGRQRQLFADVVTGLRNEGLEIPSVHIANSSALWNLEDIQFDMIRPGLSLYGYPPAAHFRNDWGLRPALSARTEIVFFKGIRRGEGVGYMHSWSAPCDGWLATLPVGYGDGYPRSLSNRGHVLIGGKAYPVVGNISMDQLMVWTGDDQYPVGEPVVLIGQQGDQEIGAWDLAVQADTIAYDILCGWTPRVPRVYEGDGWKP